IEAIFSAADIGFRGSLVDAYAGTMTGCFFCPIPLPPLPVRLTIFLVSIPREQRSFLLLWEPPHWYFRPWASLTSCSSVHTVSSSLQNPQDITRLSSTICLSEEISSSASSTATGGKHAWKTRSRRFSRDAYIKQATAEVIFKPFTLEDIRKYI
uniref:Uncharacterized protein n=1 Tax=Callorhinchus milii TaxID=7868 RepID=A0A4W3IVC7_CALMI